jgi:hypothetical protein
MTFSSKMTFTSPTIYMAHRPMFLQMRAKLPNPFDGWGDIPDQEERYKPTGIIDVASSDILTERSLRKGLIAKGVEYAQLTANNSYQPTLWCNPRL